LRCCVLKTYRLVQSKAYTQHDRSGIVSKPCKNIGSDENSKTDRLIFESNRNRQGKGNRLNVFIYEHKCQLDGCVSTDCTMWCAILDHDIVGVWLAILH
jgi:hypothetical protein